MPRERVQRLVERAAVIGCALGEDAAERLLGYLDAMLERNRALNLTAVRDPAAAEVLHALDSLAVAAVGLAPERVLDLGSGNGFPGVALAALWPRARAVLLERTQKKARALRELSDGTGFDRVEVCALDAGQAVARHPEWAAAFDLVAVRAVGAPTAVAPLAAPFLRRQGSLVLWLDAETPAPEMLGAFRRAGLLEYALPAPAQRQRRLAHYRRQPPR